MEGERDEFESEGEKREVGDSDHTWSSKDYYTDPLSLLPLS